MPHRSAHALLVNSLRGAVFALPLLLLLVPDALGAEPAGMGLGYDYDLSGAREEFLLPDPLLDASITGQHPLTVRIRVPWARIETSIGVYDWSEVDRIVDPYHAASFRIRLCLYGANPIHDAEGGLPVPSRPAVVKGWLDFLRAAALHFQGRVNAYEVGEAPNRETAWTGEGGAAAYAYVLKNSSVTLRSADSKALVSQGALDIPPGGLEAALGWQAELYRQEVAPYVDVLPIHPSPDEPLAAAMSRAYDLMLENDPAAELAAVGLSPRGATDRERAAELMRQFTVSMGEGAGLATFDLEADVEGRPEFPGVLLDLHRLFLPTYIRRPGGGVRFDPAVDAVAYRFFDAVSYQGLVAYFAGARPENPQTTLVLDTAAVRGVALYDIVGGSAAPIIGAQADFATNTTRVPVTLRTRPLVVMYARVPIEGFEAAKEQVAVADTGLITVEEILAEHQRFMADQDYRLHHYRATARVTYHYKIGGSNSIDIGYDNQFFWEKGKGAEWQQTALYINGVRWKGTRFPDIPFIQPEKVMTLPLDINLNRDYKYEYLGRETVDGYDCYVVGFAPLDRSRTLYEGKVWIETRTFARVRTSVVQHGLVEPVTSNDERDHYRPVAGPDGTTYWLLSEVEGQQILTTAGRNLVVLREIAMTTMEINDPGFEEARNRAYASEAPILRDTDKGLRYLENGADGKRTVEAEPVRKTLFALAGLFDQPGLNSPLPLLGVNYFNYNVGGHNAQLNAFLAGVLNVVTFTDPKLFERVDGSLEAFLLGFALTDTPYLQGQKHESSNVDVQTQSLSAWLGRPLGNFFRIRGQYDFDYANYSHDKLTSDAFVVPADTSINTARFQGEFNRGGWTVSAEAASSKRARWDPWGDRAAATPETLAAFPSSPCDTPGSCFAEFDPSQARFRSYQYGLSKQFFLPAFQKIRFEVNWLNGSNMDRFSEFSFDFFGHRVRGLSGAGVRFDSGGLARVQYAFNVADVVRFEATLDHGYVRDSLTADRFSNFTGFGVSGNVMGPWRTIITFDVGVALQSDYEGLRGDAEAEVVFLKFFGGPKRLPPASAP